MKLISLFLWIYFTIFTFTFSLRVNDDGGYEDIVVAITSTISQEKGPVLINNIKTLIRRTSDNLYKASKSRFYFKSVTILLPNTWSDKELGTTTNGAELHQEAEIRVIDTSKYPHIATHQPDECGQPGTFIQIHSNFFQDSTQTQEQKDYLFLRHWARFRYGIFEETGFEDSKAFPLFYPTKNGWKVTSCNHPDQSNNNPSADCQVTRMQENCNPKEGKSFNSSIMSGTGSQQANFFCSSNKDSVHNFIAPTLQNAYCMYKSTWQVITESLDYQAVTKQRESINLEWKIVKRADVKAVIIVDSNLCHGEDEMIVSTVANSVLKTINDKYKKLALGVMIGGTIVENIKNMNTDAAENFYSSCMNTKSSDAIDLFQASKMILQTKNNFGLIVLIIHGDSKFDEHIHDFLIQNRNVDIRLHLITYPTRTNSFSFNFQPYAKSFATYNIPKSQNAQADCDLEARINLDQLLTTIFSIDNENFNLKQISISKPVYGLNQHTGAIKLPFSGKLTITAYLCNKLFKPTLNWNDIDVNTHPEAHETIIKTSSYLQYDSLFFMSIAASSENQYTFDPRKVTHYALTFWLEGATEDIEFLASVDTHAVRKKNIGMIPILKVFTNLKNAMVTSQVTEMSGSNTRYITLRKSMSEGTSIYKETYRHYFTDLAKQFETYNAIFYVTDNADPKYQSYEIKIHSSFYSELTANNVNQYPPNRIVDFRTENIDINNQIVTFQWTAPGAHFDTGTANSYYIRCETNIENITPANQYQKLDIFPQEAGALETHQWQVKDAEDLYYCTLKTKGTELSEPSNMIIVYLKLGIIDPEINSTEHPTSNSTSSTDDKTAIIGGTIGGVVFLIIVILVVLVLFHYFRKRKREGNGSAVQSSITISRPVSNIPTNIIKDSAENVPEQTEHINNDFNDSDNKQSWTTTSSFLNLPNVNQSTDSDVSLTQNFNPQPLGIPIMDQSDNKIKPPEYNHLKWEANHLIDTANLDHSNMKSNSQFSKYESSLCSSQGSIV